MIVVLSKQHYDVASFKKVSRNYEQSQRVEVLQVEMQSWETATVKHLYVCEVILWVLLWLKNTLWSSLLNPNMVRRAMSEISQLSIYPSCIRK